MTAETLAQRSFVRTRQAWYAQPVLTGTTLNEEEILCRIEAEADTGEIAIRWGVDQKPSLVVNDTAWRWLSAFQDVVKVLERAAFPISADDLCRQMVTLGVEDRTERVVPAAVLARHPRLAALSATPA
jgi:hypothetical protein